jgi:hypothetical protein
MTAAPALVPSDEFNTATESEPAQEHSLPYPFPSPFLSLKEAQAQILPSVSLSTFRWWIQTDYDGFNTECISRRGKRVFVIRENFLTWMMRGQKVEKEKNKNERREEPNPIRKEMSVAVESGS